MPIKILFSLTNYKYSPFFFTLQLRFKEVRASPQHQSLSLSLSLYHISPPL